LAATTNSQCRRLAQEPSQGCPVYQRRDRWRAAQRGDTSSPHAKRTQIEYSIEILIPAWFGERVLPVTQPIAERWGVLDAQRQKIGRPLGVADGMIAATALEHGLTLVTRNVKDFEDLGVTILNPWDTV
jgi:hypothetical protein